MRVGRLGTWEHKAPLATLSISLALPPYVWLLHSIEPLNHEIMPETSSRLPRAKHGNCLKIVRSDTHGGNPIRKGFKALQFICCFEWVFKTSAISVAPCRDEKYGVYEVCMSSFIYVCYGLACWCVCCMVVCCYFLLLDLCLFCIRLLSVCLSCCVFLCCLVPVMIYVLRVV